LIKVASLSVAVLKTIAYFDLFGYPLTTFEVWKWLWQEDGQPASLTDVDDALRSAEQQQLISVEQGLWFLRGRDVIVTTRHERHRLSIGKLTTTARVARWFSRLPWVDGIAACNSLGYRNARAQSDLDLFIIVRPGTIWLVRFLTAGAMAVLRRRPAAKHSADTICLSFFVTRDAMNLEPLATAGGDVYLTYWVTQLTPLFGRGEVWRDFWQANAWVRRYLPNTLGVGEGPTWCYRQERVGPAARWLTRTVDGWLGRWQRARLPERLRNRAAVGGSDVVVSDQVLKFHDNDRRAYYRDQWQQRVVALNFKV
jgi:hypothetical protein